MKSASKVRKHAKRAQAIAITFMCVSMIIGFSFGDYWGIAIGIVGLATAIVIILKSSKCSSCGKYLELADDKVVFCSSCGEPVDEFNKSTEQVAASDR